MPARMRLRCCLLNRPLCLYLHSARPGVFWWTAAVGEGENAAGKAEQRKQRVKDARTRVCWVGELDKGSEGHVERVQCNARRARKQCPSGQQKHRGKEREKKQASYAVLVGALFLAPI